MVLQDGPNKSVFSMFSEPVVGNEVKMHLRHVQVDPWWSTASEIALCGDIDYNFCLRVEYYGKDLGLYTK